MAKVYVVTSGDYSDYSIDRVFSNREAAEKRCATWEYKHDEPRIEEYELEDGSNIEMEHVYKALEFDMRYTYYNDTVHITDIEMKYGVNPFEEKIRMKEKTTVRNGEEIELYYGVIPVNKTVKNEEAEKIIFDRIAKWKAEQMGL